MNNELLLLIRKHTDILLEVTKTRPQETLELVMGKHIEMFSFSPPINFFEDGKCLLAVTSFETTIPAGNITDDNNSFPTPSYWTPEVGEELINELNKSLELRFENDIELQVKEVEKRSTRKK